MSTTSSIIYSEDSLVIKIQTGSPASLHHLLLRGIITSLKHQMLAEERLDDDIDGLVALADVLAKIVPNESQLVKAYDNQLRSAI